MSVPYAIAAALQTAFNRVLELDEDSAARIAKLQGKLICLQLRGLGVELWLLFHRDRMEILEHYDAEADTTIAGAPFTMLSMAIGKHGIFDGGVDVSGDVEVARNFSRLFERLDIDWEEHLSALTGDLLARKAGVAGARLGEWANRSNEAMQLNIADYLRDESQYLPHSWELDEFGDDVDDLRDRLARLETRLRTLSDKS